MAKVVIVWNEHPTEVVAGFHARRVARILRMQWGHEVIIKRIPVAKTLYRALESTPDRVVSALLTAEQESKDFCEQQSKEHDTLVFTFHTAPAKTIGEAERRAPYDFRVDEFGGEEYVKRALSGQIYRREINFLRQPNNVTLIELPAHYENLPAKLKAKREKLIQEVEKSPKIGEIARTGDLGKIMQLQHTLHENYHLRRTPLSHPNQKKYKDWGISSRIAYEINWRIGYR